MTVPRSSLRIRCTQSRVVPALLAGSTVKTWPYVFLKQRASFRPQTSECGRDGGGLQEGGPDGAEIHGVGHDAPPNAPRYVRLRRARGYLGGEARGVWLRHRRPGRRRARSPR
jgi:hypothetical protein